MLLGHLYNMAEQRKGELPPPSTSSSHRDRELVAIGDAKQCRKGSVSPFHHWPPVPFGKCPSNKFYLYSNIWS